MLRKNGDRIDSPRISVLMAVQDEGGACARPISSLLRQTFCDWELLLVYDSSFDRSADRARFWADQDVRIRAIPGDLSSGIGAARNVGLRHAKADLITYIDVDDEYSHDHLDNVARLQNRADVLVFCYDRLTDHRDGLGGNVERWDPSVMRQDLFLLGGDLVAPLGVVHRREIGVRLGGFDELLWWDVDGEFLKRLARAGASFLFLKLKSGIQGGRLCDPVHAQCPSLEQRARAEGNFVAGRTLHQKQEHSSVACRPRRRVAFASIHSIIDFSSGAAVASFDVLEGLAAEGFVCQAFCTPMLDMDREVDFERIIHDTGEPYQVRRSVCGPHQATILYTRRKRVPITIFRLDSTRLLLPSNEEMLAILSFFGSFLDSFQPDVMITIDSDPISLRMIGISKRRDIPVVFGVHNFAQCDLKAFWNVDYCTVPSELARQFYWDILGVACRTLPNPVDWDRVLVSEPKPQFVTFVNPSSEKGVYVFARIADVLGRRRLDIPFLVVESRGTSDTLMACGLDLNEHRNIEYMRNSTDPRRFWGLTKILLMPSLWWENQPLVAIEAMINGIPVIGSHRGGIPETLGGAGFLLPLPDRLTPTSDILPTAEEVEPWVETIIRLWDDRALYDEQSVKARQEAVRWHPDRLRPLYAEFFRNVHPQPGPPFLPKECQELQSC